VKAKYVIIRKDWAELPLVFSEQLQHAEMAGLHEPVAAGFCELAADGTWRVAGRSVSLNLHSRPEDAAILNAYL
jgi:hypothetical protein